MKTRRYNSILGTLIFGIAAFTAPFIYANPIVPTLISSTDFEDGTYQQFTSDGGGTKIDTNSDRACQGDVSVKLKRTSNLYHKSPPFDVSGYDDLILSFWYYPRSVERDDALSVLYSTDNGSSWNPLLDMVMGQEHPAGSNYNGKCHEKMIYFSHLLSPLDLASLDSIRLKFQAKANDKGGEFYIDGIRLEGIASTAITPTGRPTSAPTKRPTIRPTAIPTSTPTVRPTSAPTKRPTIRPTAIPTTTPTVRPTSAPKPAPSSAAPISVPSSMPTPFLDRTDICPVNKTFPSLKYEILPFADQSGLTYVEDDLSEISSLAFASHSDDANNKYAYVVSDKNQYSLKVVRFSESYDSTTLLSGTAETVAVYTLININFDNDDWEDISTGPCTDNTADGSVCIYIGNFGNNNRGGPAGYDYLQRRELSIFKFPEPAFSGPGSVPIDRDIAASIIIYDYDSTFSTTAFIDAEAMFVDWTGAYGVGKGDIYVVTKGGCGRGVGRIAASFHKDLRPGDKLDVGSMEGIREDPPPQGTVGCIGAFRAYQAADMSRNGRLIALATGVSPPRTYFFPRETGQTVADALSGSHCSYVSATSFGLLNEKQHEAVAFLDDEGTVFAETGECQGGRSCNVPIFFHTLTLTSPPSTRTADLDPVGWQLVTYDGFEDSTMGSYETAPDDPVDPDATLSTGFSCRGNKAVRLRWDNAASSSIFHSQNQDCSSFSWLRVSFQFQLDSIHKFDHLDALFVEISLNGGAVYSVVAVWAFDVDGIDTYGVCYRRTIELSAQDYGRSTFGKAVRLRFRASANARQDYVHVDDIRVEGHTGFIYIRRQV